MKRKFWNKLIFWRKNKVVSPKLGIESIVELMPTILATMVMVYAVKSLSRIFLREKYLWLKAPHGTIYKVKFYLALRILRHKKDWELVDMEPVMTRWQHFKKAIIG